MSSEGEDSGMSKQDKRNNGKEKLCGGDDRKERRLEEISKFKELIKRKGKFEAFSLPPQGRIKGEIRENDYL